MTTRRIPPAFEVVILEEPTFREPKAEKEPPTGVNEKVTIQPGDPVLDPPPDGGTRAWLCVLGCHLALFSTFGTVNAYGVFQDYYGTNLLASTSASVISLIGALQLFFLYGLGPIVGRIFDAHGSAVLLPVGSFFVVLSMMMVSICQENKVYQFFLSQGVLFGIGISMVFNPALAVMAHWFRRRRAFAIGICASGSSLGGVVYPVMLQRLIPAIGFGWAVRVSAFVSLTCLTVSCITIRGRLPHKGHIAWMSFVDLGGFRDLKYTLTAIGSFLTFYALFIPFFYIQVYGTYEGVSTRLAKYLLPIMNAASFPSRVLPGLVADRFGVLNVLVPCTILSGIFSLSIWLPSRGAIPITIFSALYGLGSGAFVTLLPAYIATITPMEVYGARVGSIYMIAAVAALVGTPTAGAFVKVVGQHDFDGLIIFTGVMVLAGGVIIGAAHVVQTRKL
ncbi:MFS general substrate transporter, partial [Neolentinus lepideus HHB14362 ss-1]